VTAREKLIRQETQSVNRDGATAPIGTTSTLADRIPAAIPAASRERLERFSARYPRGSRGWAAAAAGIVEASAPKPGNVHPGASFPDLHYEDLVAAALAMAAVIDTAPSRPLGRTISEAVAASRGVTRSNANLGIVLLIAPLAAADDGGPLGAAGVARVLARLTPDDATDIWAAIGLAGAGGLGTTSTWDLRGPPPTDLLAAMREARGRDQIARLWAEDYEPLFRGPVRDLADELAATATVADAIVRTFLRQLAREPDSLIARRHGAATAADVSARAAAALAAGSDWHAAAATLDRHLRASGHGALGERRPAGTKINPGTTADLVAAAVYILLRDPSAGHDPP
jgi:triphosphoribosyl-dephospho-CoA synthase